jgi:hypothetical protein
MADRIARSEPRIGLRLPILFGLNAPDRPGHVRNISRHGMAVSCRELVEPLARIHLRLATANGPIDAVGVVRWSRRFELKFALVENCDMGVKFVGDNGPLQAFVDETLARFADQRYELRFEKTFTVQLLDAGKAHAANVSRHGMYIVTANPPEPKSIVEVVLLLAEPDLTVHVEGMVVYAVNEKLAYERGFAPGFGFRFLRFVSRNEAEFHRYIDELTEAFYGQ